MKNREIKYRIWDTKSQMMIFWKDIINKLYKDGFIATDKWIKKNNGEIRILIWKNEIVKCLENKSDRLILMQFTGLKDANGKEIYEGDILKDTVNDKIHLIEWNNEKAKFEAIILNGQLDGSKRHIKDVKIMKIIGNR